ncbi:type I methionyl aminopeptidase [Nocardiopsis coralliicola]
MFRRSASNIQLKTAEQIALMRRAGLVVGRALEAVRDAVQPGVSTLDLDAVAERTIRDAGAVPSFKGYGAGGGVPAFPGSICASVNEQVVHGIPRADTVLAEGDVISVDCGAILDGWHGDSAITVAVGEPSDGDRAMMDACRAAMWAGIAQLRPDKRLGDIGNAIDTALRAGGYGNVQEYGGHGIGTEMHMEPHVLNHGRPGKGLRLSEGMVLAIEPMANRGTQRVSVLADDWTVVTDDGARSAHFEHTVAVTAEGPRVLTARADDRPEIERLGLVDPDG